MISSVRFLGGYPSRFSLLGLKTYSFNEKLNIIIGPNGSGKTTLLESMARAAGCGDGGWSDESKIAYPFKMELERDKQPVFYQNCYADSENSFISDAIFQEKKLLRSTGEKRIGLINELIDYMENRFLTYKLKRTERPALLLDEVDNHIGFVAQSVFWNYLVPKIIKKYQMIVSTHSIFPILLRKNEKYREDAVINLCKNYDFACIGELRKAIGIFNSED